MQAVDQAKKLTRQLREAKDDATNLQQKLTEASNRRQEVEKRNDLAESEIVTLKSDLKLAFKRIEDLQQALQGDISDSDCELSDRWVMIFGHLLFFNVMVLILCSVFIFPAFFVLLL